MRRSNPNLKSEIALFSKQCTNSDWLGFPRRRFAMWERGEFNFEFCRCNFCNLIDAREIGPFRNRETARCLELGNQKNGSSIEANFRLWNPRSKAISRSRFEEDRQWQIWINIHIFSLLSRYGDFISIDHHLQDVGEVEWSSNILTKMHRARFPDFQSGLSASALCAGEFLNSWILDEKLDHLELSLLW